MPHHLGLREALGVSRERSRDRIAADLHAEVRLDDVVVGARASELGSRVLVPVTREHDCGALVSDAPHLLQQIDRGQIAELIVEEDQLRVVVHELDEREVRIRVPVELDLDVGKLVENAFQQLELALVIVDRKYRSVLPLHPAESGSPDPFGSETDQWPAAPSDSQSASMPASWSAKRRGSSNSGCVESLTTTVRLGWWTSSACPFNPKAA